jgi:hypothetical protein
LKHCGGRGKFGESRGEFGICRGNRGHV